MTFIHSFQTLSFPLTDSEDGNAHRRICDLKELIKTLLLSLQQLTWAGDAKNCQVLNLHDPTIPQNNPEKWLLLFFHLIDDKTEFWMGGQSDNFPQAKERVSSRIRTRIRSSVVESHAHIHDAMLSFFSGHLPPSLVEGNRQRSSQSLIIITLQGKALIGGHINNLYHHLGDTQYCMFKESNLSLQAKCCSWFQVSILPQLLRLHPQWDHSHEGGCLFLHPIDGDWLRTKIWRVQIWGQHNKIFLGAIFPLRVNQCPGIPESLSLRQFVFYLLFSFMNSILSWSSWSPQKRAVC